MKKTDPSVEARLAKATDKSYYKMHLSKKDWIIMAVMVIIYSFMTFINLGNTIMPTTYWQTEKSGEYFIVDLGREVELERINYFVGVPADGSINVFYYDSESNKYLQMYLPPSGTGTEVTKKTASSVDIGEFKIVSINCRTQSGDRVTTSKLKFVTTKAGLGLGEITLYERDSTTPLTGISVDKGSCADDNNPELLFDEQEKMEYSYDFMNSTYFDEVYHGATGYMHYKGMMPYETTHPPLGKLLIALGFYIFGESMFGMRAMGALFGVLMIPLMYLFGKKLTKESFGGFAAAFLMMFDFMHFTHSRIASIDVYGVVFVILMYYFMYDYFVSKPHNIGLKKTLVSLFFSGFFMGCALSVKWNMAFGAIGLAFIFLISILDQSNDCALIRNHNLARQNPWVDKFEANYVVKVGLVCVLAFIVMPITIYCASYVPFLCATDFSTKSMFASWGDVSGQAYTAEDVLKLQTYMYSFHSTLKEVQYFNSSWYSWPVIGKPLWMYLSADNVDGLKGTIVTMGNPAVWWGGIAGVFFAIVYAIKNKDRRLMPIVIALASLYLPWILVTRGTYIYHYFPILPFVILCLAYVLTQLWKKSKKWKIGIVGYFVVIVLLFIMFYPALTGIKVSSSYIDTFLKWFPTWTF